MKIAASYVILTNLATDAIYVDVLFSVCLYEESLVSHVNFIIKDLLSTVCRFFLTLAHLGP